MDVYAVGGFPGCSMVPELGVISAESSDAYPDVLKPAVTRRVLSDLSLQSIPHPALQGTLVAAPSSGQCLLLQIFGANHPAL